MKANIQRHSNRFGTRTQQARMVKDKQASAHKVTMIKMTKSVIIWTAHKCYGIDVKINSFWDHRAREIGYAGRSLCRLLSLHLEWQRITTEYLIQWNGRRQTSHTMPHIRFQYGIMLNDVEHSDWIEPQTPTEVLNRQTAKHLLHAFATSQAVCSKRKMEKKLFARFHFISML